MKRFLLSPDPAEGGDNKPVNQNPAQPPAEKPPAAEAVLTGDRTERELQLQEDLRKANERADRAEGTVKERETKISELEDRAHQASQASAGQESKPFRLRRIKL